MSAVYVLRVQFISLVYSLCPQSTVYVLRGQFMSSEYSLCPKSTVCVPKYDLYLWSTLYVTRVQF